MPGKFKLIYTLFPHGHCLITVNGTYTDMSSNVILTLT